MFVREVREDYVEVPSSDPAHAVAPVDSPAIGLSELPTGPRHVLLVSSSGGHLAQLLALRPWWEQRSRSWVTFNTADASSQLAGEDVVSAHFPTTRNFVNLVRNTALALRVVTSLNPDMVVSTGAGVALPFFVVAKILGIPTVYIEVFDRLETRTVTGRLCRPISDLFLVQWEQQQTMYPGSRVVGTLM